ncbi:hypothetical protein CLOLEP_01908 [[Clostridium] leptum DSM 753]|uniref:Uncharacterized protein n=1 Tax=[Clostridium] leptum DSM 753 TaxID=428125 RepID=A7VTL6_9FIRM|nr:hypothetical protein CLOLEP_01908 [[Clostridium] leptum DSM 753]
MIFCIEICVFLLLTWKWQKEKAVSKNTQMLIITKHHCCPNLRGSDVNGVFIMYDQDEIVVR